MEIYVACLGSYNAGKLHGDWIDVDGLDVEDLQEEINLILESSPEGNAEEWAVHDYKDFPNLGEHPNLERVATVAKMINDHSLEAVEAFLGFHSLDDIESFNDRYCGKYESMEDYAKSLYEETCKDELNKLPKGLYIDWERVANDLNCNGYGIDKGHVFQP